ncbi:hypothetical protein JP75_14035 [Devosia riboflavina]|uniref:Uncharacterized protein n=1 Tax=Devosia riboflavina TaxID=46914 RepID=A0A087M150_9HYPH|nr:hypothetical protein JP75_14035 [Devosia riboflavina]
MLLVELLSCFLSAPSHHWKVNSPADEDGKRRVDADPTAVAAALPMIATIMMGDQGFPAWNDG